MRSLHGNTDLDEVRVLAEQSRDGWFAGYTKDLLVITWVGFDDGRDLNLEGARSALPIFPITTSRLIARRTPEQAFESERTAISPGADRPALRSLFKWTMTRSGCLVPRLPAASRRHGSDTAASTSSCWSIQREESSREMKTISVRPEVFVDDRSFAHG